VRDIWNLILNIFLLSLLPIRASGIGYSPKFYSLSYFDPFFLILLSIVFPFSFAISSTYVFLGLLTLLFSYYVHTWYMSKPIQLLFPHFIFYFFFIYFLCSPSIKFCYSYYFPHELHFYGSQLLFVLWYQISILSIYRSIFFTLVNKKWYSCFSSLSKSQ